MTELMRLRIPTGWVVLDNKLYDADPIVDQPTGSIENWTEGFVEDVLWIQESRVNENTQYEIPKTNHFNIDISWLPDSSLNGKYFAKLSWCGLDEMIDLENFGSKNRFEIRDKIEFWMSDIKENYSDYLKRIEE